MNPPRPAEVSEERVGDNEVIFVRGPRTSKAVSVLLRGANDFLLDEMDRSLHDVLCVVQRVLESKSVVAGGGAVEAALSMYLEAFSTTLATKEQLAIKEFAEALLAIPKTLAVNAAKDSTELVAKLCSFHHAAQQSVSFFLGGRGALLRASLLPLAPFHTGAPPSLHNGGRPIHGVQQRLVFFREGLCCRRVCGVRVRGGARPPRAASRPPHACLTAPPPPPLSRARRRRRATCASWALTWWGARP